MKTGCETKDGWNEERSIRLSYHFLFSGLFIVCFYAFLISCLYSHRNLPAKGVILIMFQPEAVSGELIEILDGSVHGQGWTWVRLPFQQLLHHGYMPVVDMGVCNNMDQFAGFQAAYLRQHVEQDRVLAYVPAVGCQHVLGALV